MARSRTGRGSSTIVPALSPVRFTDAVGRHERGVAGRADVQRCRGRFRSRPGRSLGTSVVQVMVAVAPSVPAVATTVVMTGAGCVGRGERSPAGWPPPARSPRWWPRRSSGPGRSRSCPASGPFSVTECEVTRAASLAVRFSERGRGPVVHARARGLVRRPRDRGRGPGGARRRVHGGDRRRGRVGLAVVKLAGGLAATGEVASLVAASVERTRKKYVVPGVRPVRFTECEVTSAGSLMRLVQGAGRGPVVHPRGTGLVRGPRDRGRGPGGARRGVHGGDRSAGSCRGWAW